MVYPLSFWIGFHALIIFLLAMDLTVSSKRTSPLKIPSALWMSGYWIALALLFNGFIYLSFGKEPAIQFFTGYLLEKSLSVDNLFVFLMLFTHFKIPFKDQHRVLFWGVLGAIVFRMAFILSGVYFISRFHWILYPLGALLCVTGIRFAIQKRTQEQFEESRLLTWIQRWIPYSPRRKEGHFFIQEKGKWKATPLFVALIFIEITDIIFAVDSVPAIFAITLEPFIIYTSNIFAILGLRSLYFALAKSLEKLQYLHFGLAAILIFIGFKMIFSAWIAIPILLSLGVIVGILAVTVILSLQKIHK